ncbi:MAG: hypothetical protein JWL86_5132 [Rhizobium sp.]|nr:hypothetical protein [Rhizobium sp.]
MKKFIIGAAAALIATVSLSATAEAGHRWHHRHHGWHHGHHHGYKIWIGGRHHGDYCFVKKIKRYDDWGNMYVKRMRVCGW